MVGSRGTRDISLKVCFYVSRGVRQGVGGYWARPRASGGAVLFSAEFRLRSGISMEKTSRVLKPKWDLDGDVGSYLWPTICSSALHGGPPPRPPPFICTLFHTGIRPCTALALHVAVMGSTVPSPSTPLAPCCSQSTRSGLQQVRLLRKLMPGKGSYMDVLCYLLKAWKRCAVPAAIASC